MEKNCIYTNDEIKHFYDENVKKKFAQNIEKFNRDLNELF